MKRFYLKKWIENLIVVIQIILFVFMISESEDLKIFILLKIISIILFYINHLILKNYTRLYDFE